MPTRRRYRRRDHPHPSADGHEPCYGCECCRRWTRSLELLRNSIREHVAGEIKRRLRRAPCGPDCLVCQTIDWQGVTPDA